MFELVFQAQVPDFQIRNKITRGYLFNPETRNVDSSVGIVARIRDSIPCKGKRLHSVQTACAAYLASHLMGTPPGVKRK